MDVRFSVVLVANEMWNVTMEKKIQRERERFSLKFIRSYEHYCMSTGEKKSYADDKVDMLV